MIWIENTNQKFHYHKVRLKIFRHFLGIKEKNIFLYYYSMKKMENKIGGKYRSWKMGRLF